MGVTAVLLEAVKAQQKQIEELKSQVRRLENRLSPGAPAVTSAGRPLTRLAARGDLSPVPGAR